MSLSTSSGHFSFETTLKREPLLQFSREQQRYIDYLRDRRSRTVAPIHRRFDQSGNAIVVNHHARAELGKDRGERNLQNVSDIVTIQENYDRFLGWIGARTEADLQEVFEAAKGQLTMTDLKSVAPMIVLAYIYEDPLCKPPVAAWTVQHLYDFMEWVCEGQGDSWYPAMRPECELFPVKAPERPKLHIGTFVKDSISSKGVVRRHRRMGSPVYIVLNAISTGSMPSHRYVDRRGGKVARSEFEPIKGIDPAGEAAKMAVAYDAREKKYMEQHNRQLIVFAAQWVLHLNHVRPRRRLALQAAIDIPPLTLTELKMKLYPFSKRV